MARVCLDMLRSRKSRREEPLERTHHREAAGNPEEETALADSVGLALLVVLDTLNPAERLAFVLHEMFGVPFEEIARIVGKSPAAARQLASRARRRVRGAAAPAPDVDRQREVVGAFLAALRAGDFERLLAVLDPDVVVHIDEAAARSGAPREVRGDANWAKQAIAFARGAEFVEPALVDGAVGLILAPRGRLSRVLRFSLLGGKIVRIDIVGDPERLRELEVAVLDD